jgi:hypothetical protein
MPAAYALGATSALSRARGAAETDVAGAGAGGGAQAAAAAGHAASAGRGAGALAGVAGVARVALAGGVEGATAAHVAGEEVGAGARDAAIGAAPSGEAGAGPIALADARVGTGRVGPTLAFDSAGWSTPAIGAATGDSPAGRCYAGAPAGTHLAVGNWAGCRTVRPEPVVVANTLRGPEDTLAMTRTGRSGSSWAFRVTVRACIGHYG